MALNYTLVGGEQARHWMLVLHGIYGSGTNWRTFARGLVGRRPEWGAVLVDLRMHGASQSMRPPHTVAAAARDLCDLAEVLGAERPVTAVAGHSFGGKVALALAQLAPPDLEQVWIMDASPSARPGAIEDPANTVAAVLRIMEEMPVRFASRDDFTKLVLDAGFPAMLASWLAMNLQHDDGGYRFRLDPAVMAALLRDYYALDLWSAVEEARVDTRFVVAGASTTVDAADRLRLAALQKRPDSKVHLEVIPDASHWLHIDALEQLLALVSGGLP